VNLNWLSFCSSLGVRKSIDVVLAVFLLLLELFLYLFGVSVSAFGFLELSATISTISIIIGDFLQLVLSSVIFVFCLPTCTRPFADVPY